VTPELLAQVAGLALIDALNPATVATVALLLLAPLRRPVGTAVSFVVGAYATVLAAGAGVLLGAGSAASGLAGGTAWVRRVALVLAATMLAVAAVRRLRTRRRAAVSLPSWVGPWAALPLAVLVTGADLPNAFPYVVAVERLLAADVGAGTGLLVLAGYALVYVLPCLLLVVGASALGPQRVAARLRPLHARFGAARTVPASVPAALGLGALAAVLVGLAVP
jgi:uncharacterized membrane protein